MRELEEKKRPARVFVRDGLARHRLARWRGSGGEQLVPAGAIPPAGRACADAAHALSIARSLTNAG